MIKLGLGTVQFGRDYGFTKKKSEQQAHELLAAARRLGIRFVDTAPDYGDSEEKIGSFLKKTPKSGLFVATKIAFIPRAVAGDPGLLRRHVMGSVKRSKQALGVEAIDLLQLHQSEAFITENQGFWLLVEELLSDRTIRSFGLSVYETPEVKRLVETHGAHIRYIQAPYSIFNQSFREIFELLEEKKIHFIARSVFLKGIVSADMKSLPKELGKMRAPKERLDALCAQSGLTRAETAILFSTDPERVNCALFGADSIGELEANVRALSKRGQFLKIKEALRSLHVQDAFLTDPRSWSEFT